MKVWLSALLLGSAIGYGLKSALLGFYFSDDSLSSCITQGIKRYFLIEIVTLFFTAMTILHFGFHWLVLGPLCLTWILILLTFIDIEHQLLPDSLTLPCLWGGLLFNLFVSFTPLKSAVLGAALGYLFLWGLYWGFKALTHKEGMGYGDFKLLAMLGAWLGWQALPAILFFASALGSSVGLSLVFFKKRAFHTPLPFGPFLALAGWMSLVWNDKICYFYLRG